MSTRVNLPISLKKIIFSSYYKSSYQTTSSSSNRFCQLSIGRGLNQWLEKHNCYDNIFIEKPITSDCKKMPIITTAVAAHRQSHHTHLLHQQFSLLELKSGRRKVDTVNNISLSGFDYRKTTELHNRGLIHVCKTQSSLLPYNKEIRRYYAKGKDKPKTKKSIVTINEAEIGELVDVQSLKQQLEKVFDQMKDEFSKQLSIRGAAGALETLTVEFEGETYPLQELAQVGRKNPQLAVLNLSSLPDACQPVLKAILDSGMNLNPQQEGTTIYVPLPKVTREHRENLSKNAKAIFNKCKTSFQSVQNKFVRQCKSQNDISEDLSFRVQQQIMKITESYITEAEKLLQVKQSELLDTK